jgi:pilus assembly protein Flp/PilA
VSFIKRILFNQDGATAIEYAMIAVGIALAIVGVIFSLGDTLEVEYFQKVADAF